VSRRRTATAGRGADHPGVLAALGAVSAAARGGRGRGSGCTCNERRAARRARVDGDVLGWMRAQFPRGSGSGSGRDAADDRDRDAAGTLLLLLHGRAANSLHMLLELFPADAVAIFGQRFPAGETSRAAVVGNSQVRSCRRGRTYLRTF
jgi:hypothetical protein